MFYIKPDFYHKFKCIAHKCTDSCCIGWEIDIDENTLRKYKGKNCEFGEKIRSEIITAEDGSRCFALGENERCPFLNDKNLCEIIINCGEEYLCDICREHPRFYEWFPGVTECGLGLCCEEVCRLLLENENGFSLIEENDGEKISLDSEEDTYQSDYYIVLSGIRDDFFKILFDKDLSFEDKLVKILTKTEEFCGEKCTVKNYDKSLEEYKKTEPIDEKWTRYINTLSEDLSDILKVGNEFNKTFNNMLYSKILAYIMYRHLTKAVFDESFKERVSFCIESVRFICLCDMKTFRENGNITLKDRIENLKNWSKQIEYSEENTDLLIYGVSLGEI
ncbi:MAG: flagellin lysine-N-methylase [Acutalibacteraceae bacterium]